MSFSFIRASSLSINTGVSERLALVITKTGHLSNNKICNGLYGKKIPNSLFSDSSMYEFGAFFLHSTIGLSLLIKKLSSTEEISTNSFAV